MRDINLDVLDDGDGDVEGVGDGDGDLLGPAEAVEPQGSRCRDGLNLG